MGGLLLLTEGGNGVSPLGVSIGKSRDGLPFLVSRLSPAVAYAVVHSSGG